MSPAEQHAFENALLWICLGIAALAGLFIWRVWIWPAMQRNRSHYPLPPVVEISRLDYVSRVLQHVPCEAYPCSHKPWPGQHCRTCDLPYPCPLSGPLNNERSFEIPDRHFNRQQRETGRW